MKKISLQLDFDEIRKRIEVVKQAYTPSKWADLVGVSRSVVSNVHGKNAKQKPSLEYIIAVSIATQKPVDYFIFGDKSESTNNEATPDVAEHLHQARFVLEANHPDLTPALEHNIRAFHGTLLRDLKHSRQEIRSTDKPIDKCKLIKKRGT